MAKTSTALPFSPDHRPYVRAPTASRPPAPRPKRKRGKAAKRRAPRQTYPVPLSLLAELLGCSATTPYGAAKRFGLALWVKARLREQLTRGANYAVGLQLEQAIRFNLGLLERLAQYVLAMRTHHQGATPDPDALARLLGVTATAVDALTVWTWHLQQLADELVEASRSGYLEDLPWAKAEHYLDRLVVPRVRSLTRVDPTAEEPPHNQYGGFKRRNRILDGLTSKNPAIVQATAESWDVARLHNPDVPDPHGWGLTMAELQALVTELAAPETK